MSLVLMDEHFRWIYREQPDLVVNAELGRTLKAKGQCPRASA